MRNSAKFTICYPISSKLLILLLMDSIKWLNWTIQYLGEKIVFREEGKIISQIYLDPNVDEFEAEDMIIYICVVML